MTPKKKMEIPLKNLPTAIPQKICPKCGSINVSKYILPFPNGATDTKKTECEDCGSIFPDDEVEFVAFFRKEE